MGLRETLNQNPGITMGVVGTVTLLLVIWIVVQLWPTAPAGVGGETFYTVDDGASFFRDSASKPPPFDRGGQQAVRAYIYQCGRDRFVGYMLRFTEEAHKIFEAEIARGDVPSQTEYVVGTHNVEVKKPGQAEWVKLSAPNEQLLRATQVTCPDGTYAEPVLP
jgi:hypothetical protein